MKFEGHFLLWYIILMPFAKLGFPYYTTNIISCIITCLSVWLILDKAPFRFYKRVLLIFSFPLLYLYPIISRCYCLIPLAIVLMCIFYKDRKEKPLRYLLSTVLLANTHVIMLGMVGVVLLEYICEFYKESKSISGKEKKKIIICIIITIALLIISLLPLIGCLGLNQDLEESNNFLNKIINAILYCPIVVLMEIFKIFMMNINIICIIIALASILLFYEIKNYPLTYLKFGICIMWQFFIYSFVYSSSMQRSATIIFIWLFFKWTTYKDKKKINDIDKKISNFFLITLAIANIVGGIIYISIFEITYSCSNAYEMGEYINENIDDESIILNGPRVESTSSIIPYVNKNIKYYHITGNRYFTYAIWDKQNKLNIKIEDIENLKNVFDKNQKLYYMNNKGKTNYDDEKKLIEECINKGIFKELFSTNEESIYHENYVIYEVDLEKI